MDGIVGFAIVGAWIWLTAVSLVRVVSERRRWQCQHPGLGKSPDNSALAGGLEPEPIRHIHQFRE
jgi:hypothetical protein